MKNGQEKKYPLSLFITGFFMNMVRHFLLSFASIVLLIVGIWFKLCFFIGLLLLLINVFASFVEQARIKNATLYSDNPNFTEWKEALLSSDWRDSVKNLTESKIIDSVNEKYDD